MTYHQGITIGYYPDMGEWTYNRLDHAALSKVGINTRDYHFGNVVLAQCNNDTTSNISSMSSAWYRTFIFLNWNWNKLLRSIFMNLFHLCKVFYGWDIFFVISWVIPVFFTRFIVCMFTKVLLKCLFIIWFSKFKVLEKGFDGKTAESSITILILDWFMNYELNWGLGPNHNVNLY